MNLTEKSTKDFSRGNIYTFELMKLASVHLITWFLLNKEINSHMTSSVNMCDV